MDLALNSRKLDGDSDNKPCEEARCGDGEVVEGKNEASFEEKNMFSVGDEDDLCETFMSEKKCRGWIAARTLSRAKRDAGRLTSPTRRTAAEKWNELRTL